MAGTWLMRSGDVLASLGPTPSGRTVGRLPTPPVIVLRRNAVVHTFAGRGLDVAWCKPAGREGFEVWRMRRLGRGRYSVARPRAGAVVVAEPGAFERWSLAVGDRIDVRGP